MFKRMNDWMDKPFTNRSYLTWFGIVMAIYAVIIAIWGVVLFWDDIVEKIKKPFKALKDFFTVRVVIHKDEAE